ncbi:MAG: hypothetical protein ACOCXP_02500 [Candidatus Dojkabacteria bacterium]
MPTSNLKTREEKIYRFLANSPDDLGFEKLAEELGISKKNLEEDLEKHYYLAPNNLLRAQRYLAMLSIILAVALTILQISQDPLAIIMAAAVGFVISIPYTLIYLALSVGQQRSKIKFIYYFSFVYTIFLSFVFSIFAILLQLYMAGLIPVVISVLFYFELQKLHKLISKLNGS